MINVGLIGCGNFGKNYIKTIESLQDQCRLKIIGRKSPQPDENYATTNNFHYFFSSDVRACIVCVPAETHYSLCKLALERGLHCIVEKPFTLNYIQSLELNLLAKSKNLNLCINHIDLFNTGYRLVKNHIKQPTFLEYDIAGMVKRNDCNVVWDYLSHPIAVTLDIFGGFPEIVDLEGNDDYVGVKLKFGEAYARLNASRIKPNKLRCVDLWSENGHCYFDMISNEIWDNTSDEWKLLKYDKTLPLTVLLKEFCGAVEAKEVRFSADLACNVVKLLEEIDGRLK